MSSDSVPETNPIPVVSKFSQYSQELEQMRIERHVVGQEKYGAFTFLEKDMWTMIEEEIADAMNYMEYQFIKFRLLRDAVQAELDMHVDEQGYRINNFKKGM